MMVVLMMMMRRLKGVVLVGLMLLLVVGMAGRVGRVSAQQGNQGEEEEGEEEVVEMTMDGERMPASPEEECRARVMELLSDLPMPGMHLGCVYTEGEKLWLKLWLEGNRERASAPHELEVPRAQGQEPWQAEDVVQAVRAHPRVARTFKRLPAERTTMFTTDGMEVDTMMERALDSGEPVVFTTGGHFIWPPVRIGYTREVTLPGLDHRVTIETLSLRPVIFSVKNFLTPDECKHIRTRAEPHMRQSAVSKMDKDVDLPDTTWRTSATYFLPSNNDDILRAIHHRAASLTRVPKENQEVLQTLRYELGQKYDSHTDYFDPRMYQQDKHTLRTIDNGRRNRFITVLWYLSDVEAGGETTFPRFGGARERSMTDCQTGLQVKPELGKVIMFYSTHASGELDDKSLHGGCPVHNGTKWAANLWVWNAPRGGGGIEFGVGSG